jgi:type III restriction enzyme
MISEYRLLIAQNELINISLKPVILFKNPKGIKAVDKSLDDFNKLIENLSVEDIDAVFSQSDILAISELHEIVKDKKQSFVNQLKHSFRENVCVKIYSTSADKEETLNLLNSLEDEHNNIRVIFAVNVLNEGWDVLNLFDVVKLDEAKTTGASTTSEAQLIGRGARYFPFEYKDKDRYKRKFESSDPLRMMEAMYFHSVNDNKYIEKLETTLNDMGILDKQEEKLTYEFVPKEAFANHHLYIQGVVYENSRQKIDKKRYVTGIDFYTKNYKRVQITYDNETLETKLLEKIDEVKYLKATEHKLKDFESDLVRVALNKKEFFYFKNLKTMFPNLKSIKEFISSANYLGSIVFYVKSIKEIKIENRHKIEMLLKALDSLEYMIVKNNREFIALQDFKAIPIRERISLEPKQMKYSLNKDGSEPPIINYDDKDWYVYKQHRATSEEKDFVDFISDNISKLKDKYSDIKLLRNEKAFNLYSMDSEKEADKFEPDFILLLEDKNSAKCYHQVFVEPKGNWAKGNADTFEKSHEKWKQDILLKITELTKTKAMKLININDNLDTTFYENPCYKVLGLPFWNSDTQDIFIDEFDRLLLE